MLSVFLYPDKSEWKSILKRPQLNTESLDASVSNILNEVKEHGDAALKKFASMFDKVTIENFIVTSEEIDNAATLIDQELKDAINNAKQNIEKFHAAQISKEPKIEVQPGITCWRKSLPIERVGLYIPGGTAPLFSTILMLAIPAKLAGCKEIILCSPPDKAGSLHPAILYTAQLVGISAIYKVGGAQAIGAMAYGTETITQVSKIFGPGNQYVTAAKQLVQKDGVAIDMPAGPSEVAILADDTAVPEFIAADLLSQAEHGIDSQVLLVTTSEKIANETAMAVQQQLTRLPRLAMAKQALEHSKIVVVKTMEEGVALINKYAPEHLIIATENDETIGEKIMNAGSVFLGNYSPESVGDYASGTNHTLPTNGYARAYSGVSVDSFVKKVTFQKLTEAGLHSIAKTVEVMAEAEGLMAHANAVRVRVS